VLAKVSVCLAAVELPKPTSKVVQAALASTVTVPGLMLAISPATGGPNPVGAPVLAVDQLAVSVQMLLPPEKYDAALALSAPTSKRSSARSAS
jgi:hypothetical protein